MDKLTSKGIADRLTELANEKGYTWLEQVAYELDTTPTYLIRFARMASATSNGKLVLTYEKDQFDGHKAYILATKETFNKHNDSSGPHAEPY
jgi:agmatine/peptidylarginine deiminase